MRKIVIVLAVILIIVGCSLLLFRPVSNYIGNKTTDQMFNDFIQEIQDDNIYDSNPSTEENKSESKPNNDETTETERRNKETTRIDKKRLLQDSIKYNNSIKEIKEYDFSYAVLDLPSYGINDYIYGYVYAPTIDMKLPIYLGSNSSTMEYGASHLSCTSLPINQKNTNAVLAGHTGYIGRVFFDNLKNLNIGDSVSVYNYWEEIKYNVIDKDIIKPNSVDHILIEEGKQLLTLITCTPSSDGEFDRYVVICEKQE